ncbi:MAG: hypothetical protein EBU90_23115 [Proteobacteria bacterium]|nr:hypothetical protein [Pseudomonadota bacterium]NBP15202.1 hypothetical protein [bacterium]
MDQKINKILGLCTIVLGVTLLTLIIGLFTLFLATASIVMINYGLKLMEKPSLFALLKNLCNEF